MRIHLELPSVIHFRTNIPIRITDINYGGHLANDSILSIIHEARVQFYKHFGYDELNVEGIGTIMSDVAIMYKSEAFYGDVLEIEMSVAEFVRVSHDLYYRLVSSNTGAEVARAKTHMVFFDYNEKRVKTIPKKFQELFL